MAGVIEITCERCGYRQRLTERSRQYRFPDERTATIEQALAWCRACQRVVEAEQLPSISEMDDQIREVRDGAEGLTASGRNVHEELQQLQEYREWRLARQSPPECLECGSSSIETFSQDENGNWRALQHPGCGGRLAYQTALDSQAALVRDVFGPLPFGAHSIALSTLTWRSSALPRLAQTLYEERTFDRLPILADSLEEADGTDADILGHLRAPGPHVRGCWALDLLLGKA